MQLNESILPIHGVPHQRRADQERSETCPTSVGSNIKTANSWAAVRPKFESEPLQNQSQLATKMVVPKVSKQNQTVQYSPSDEGRGNGAKLLQFERRTLWECTFLLFFFKTVITIKLKLQMKLCSCPLREHVLLEEASRCSLYLR